MDAFVAQSVDKNYRDKMVELLLYECQIACSVALNRPSSRTQQNRSWDHRSILRDRSESAAVSKANQSKTQKSPAIRTVDGMNGALSGNTA